MAIYKFSKVLYLGVLRGIKIEFPFQFSVKWDFPKVGPFKRVVVLISVLFLIFVVWRLL